MRSFVRARKKLLSKEVTSGVDQRVSTTESEECDNLYEEEHGCVRLAKIGDQSLSAAIEQILGTSTAKAFEKLHICDQHLTVLEKNTLCGYEFESILITNCPNLVRVHPLAFDDQAAGAVKEFRCGDGSSPTLEHDPSSSNPDLISDVDGFLSRLVNCEEIYLKPYKTACPALGLSKLQRLLLTGYHGSIKVESIEARALSQYTALRCLMIAGAKISNISPQAFYFDEPSSEKLTIELWDCSLNEKSFPRGSLEHFQRPVRLDWQFNQSTYLEEVIFRPFLDAHPENEVAVTDETLEVESGANQWIYHGKRKKAEKGEKEKNNDTAAELDDAATKATDRGYESRVHLEARP